MQTQEEKKRILIVEDDATIAGEVQKGLIARDFDARVAGDLNDVMAGFAAAEPHLVLMDVSLPRYNGYYWCARIRERSAVPVVFLSSHGEDMDIVMAMQMGGDDYITKPFSMDVLVAKLQAVLRRAAGSAEAELGFAGARLDAAAGCLRAGEVKVELTRNELRILQTLIERKNKTVPRDELMLRLWDTGEFIDDNTLSVNVNRLRKKLPQALAAHILTKKGEGYLLYDP